MCLDSRAFLLYVSFLHASPLYAVAFQRPWLGCPCWPAQRTVTRHSHMWLHICYCVQRDVYLRVMLHLGISCSELWRSLYVILTLCVQGLVCGWRLQGLCSTRMRHVTVLRPSVQPTEGSVTCIPYLPAYHTSFKSRVTTVPLLQCRHSPCGLYLCVVPSSPPHRHPLLHHKRCPCHGYPAETAHKTKHDAETVFMHLLCKEARP